MGTKYDLERDTSHHPIEPKVLLKGNFPEQAGDASNRKEAGTQSRFTEMGYPHSTRSWVNSFLEISLGDSAKASDRLEAADIEQDERSKLRQKLEQMIEQERAAS